MVLTPIWAYINSIKPRFMDLEAFDSPLAKKVEWKPSTWGGWKVITHRLRVREELHGTSYKFQLSNTPSWGLGILFGICFLGSISVFARAPESGALLVFLLPAIFLAIFIYCLKSSEFVFYHSKGLWGRRGMRAKRKFNDIHALQLLSRYNRNKNRNFYSYELNLVFQDASKLNLINHYGLLATREDASLLANILGVPLWDAIDEEAEEWGLSNNC